MSEFAPVLYVDVYQSRAPRFRGKSRRQPWRFRILSEGNRKILASGESYANRRDALRTAVLLCAGADVDLEILLDCGWATRADDGTITPLPDWKPATKFLRQQEQGNKLLSRPSA